VNIIDSGEAVARQTRKVLIENDLLHDAGGVGQHKLFSNSDPSVLSLLVNASKNNYEVSYLEY
jgi:glutamate racemase